MDAEGRTHKEQLKNIQLTAQLWGFCQIWRHIIEIDETCLVCHDDHLPRKDYHELLEIIENLEDFKFLHWQWFKRDEGVGQKDPTTPSSVPFVRTGIAGSGDKIMIVSPEGAHILLEMASDFLTEFGYPSTEDIFIPFYKGKDRRKAPTGFYSIEASHDNPNSVNSELLFDIHCHIDNQQDSNIMFYYPGQEPSYKFKVPVEDTNFVPDTIDWNYYENVLPKLKAHYARTA